jgi:FAD synthetase
MPEKIDLFFHSLSTVRNTKYKNRKIVLAGGCFDILHYGHIQFLNKSYIDGYVMAIALESDEFIAKNKGRNPIHNQEQRKTILESLRVVDWVIQLPYFTKNEYYQKLVEVLQPKIIAVSENDPQLKNKKSQASKVRATVVTVTPIISGLSSSRIANNVEGGF